MDAVQVRGPRRQYGGLSAARLRTGSGSRASSAAGLLGLAAVGGLLPLQALLAARRRRPRPQALEAAALGAHAYVRAAAGHQGGLLGQSLRQLVRLPGPAQLAVAEGHGAPGPALLLGDGGLRRR